MHTSTSSGHGNNCRTTSQAFTVVHKKYIRLKGISSFKLDCELCNSAHPFYTVAEKCETTLQCVKHFYEPRDKFTFWKTFLRIIKHIYIGENTITKDETNLHFRKQINKTQNSFTSPETNLQWQILAERECTTHRNWRYTQTPEVTRWGCVVGGKRQIRFVVE